jgi:hypothetical protein
VVSLGPLVADGAGSHLEAGPGRTCLFRPAGIDLGRQQVPWSDVTRLTVEAPPRHRWLRAAPTIAVSVAAGDLSVASVRRRTVAVRIGTPRWAGPRVDLGRPPSAPYRSRDLAALTDLLDLLAARARLPALGDPTLVPRLIEAGPTAASLLD